MVGFLTQEWLDAQRSATADLPAAADADAVVQHVVSGTPDGNVSYYTTFADGRIADASIGAAPGDPDLTITATFSDARRLAKGDIDLSAAYMQGTVKVEGDMRRLFTLLPATHRPDFRAAVATVAATTDF